MDEEVKDGLGQEPQYLTKEEFGKSAAFIRTLAAENKELKTMVSALVEKGEDGSFRLKSASKRDEPKEGKADWQTELSALKAELKRRDDLIAEKDRKAEETARRSAVVEALAKSGAVNPSRDAVHLFDKIKTNSSGKFVAYSQDESGMDVETPLDNVVAQFLKANPELVQASKKPGSGTPTSSGSGTYDLNDLDMKNYVKNRSKLFRKE